MYTVVEYYVYWQWLKTKYHKMIYTCTNEVNFKTGNHNMHSLVSAKNSCLHSTSTSKVRPIHSLLIKKHKMHENLHTTF